MQGLKGKGQTKHDTAQVLHVREAEDGPRQGACLLARGWGAGGASDSKTKLTKPPPPTPTPPPLTPPTLLRPL